ncbi:MAG: helicase-related protein [Coprobacillus sp.]
MKEQDKLEFLMKLLCNEKPETCIIFGKTREHVDDICGYISRKGCSVDKIHGGMEQDERIANMRAFKRGQIRILVATDVASRGIDIENVTHIINFDMPDKTETYVHRIGRAGRVEATGVAISFIGQYDDQRVEELEKFLGYPLIIKERENIDTLKLTKAMLDDLGVPKMQKEEKGKTLRQDTMKLYISAGKSKKMRPGNIVGMICEINGVDGDDIGVINVQENQSYVDILNNKGKVVIEALKDATFKGKRLKVQKAKEKNN